MSRLAMASALSACLFVVSCTSNGPYGGPIPGPIDNHCYVLPDGGSPGAPLSAQNVDTTLNDAGTALVGACTLTSPDGGTSGGGPQYGATMYNSSSNDDDCKYQIGWWSTPIQQNSKVTFWVSNVFTQDGTPMALINAPQNTIAEVFLNDHHPAPNASAQVTTAVDAGIYMITPVTFDQPGQWTVRFHFNEECNDVSSNSPHGHAAFYVNVP
jgi:hypothetical protein